jgi:hypothetical protein
MVRLLASTLAAIALVAAVAPFNAQAVPLDAHSEDGDRPDPQLIAAMPRSVVHPWSDDPHVQVCAIRTLHWE